MLPWNLNVLRKYCFCCCLPSWFPGESSINVWRKPPPVLINLTRKPWSHTVLGQLPIVVSLEHIGASVCCQEYGINFGVGTDVVIVEVWIQSRTSKKWNDMMLFKLQFLPWDHWNWLWDTWDWSFRPIQSLHCIFVIPAELEIGVPAPVEWRHHSLSLVRVGQAQAVAQLVHNGLLQISALRKKSWIMVDK